MGCWSGGCGRGDPGIDRSGVRAVMVDRLDRGPQARPGRRRRPGPRRSGHDDRLRRDGPVTGVAATAPTVCDRGRRRRDLPDPRRGRRSVTSTGPTTPSKPPESSTSCWTGATTAPRPEPNSPPSPRPSGAGAPRSSPTTAPAHPTALSRQRTLSSSRSSDQAAGSATPPTTGSASSSPAARTPPARLNPSRASAPAVPGWSRRARRQWCGMLPGLFLWIDGRSRAERDSTCSFAAPMPLTGSTRGRTLRIRVGDSESDVQRHCRGAAADEIHDRPKVVPSQIRSPYQLRCCSSHSTMRRIRSSWWWRSWMPCPSRG